MRPQAEHVGRWTCDPILYEAPRQDKPPVNQRWPRAVHAGTNRRRGACGTSQTIQGQHLELHDQRKPHGALEPQAVARQRLITRAWVCGCDSLIGYAGQFIDRIAAPRCEDRKGMGQRQQRNSNSTRYGPEAASSDISESKNSSRDAPKGKHRSLMGPRIRRCISRAVYSVPDTWADSNTGLAVKTHRQPSSNFVELCRTVQGFASQHSPGTLVLSTQ